jgi:hypothetical protein
MQPGLTFTPTPPPKTGVESQLSDLQGKMDSAFAQVAGGANMDILGDFMDAASKDLVSRAEGNTDTLDEWVTKMFTMSDGPKQHQNPTPTKDWQTDT